MPATAATAQGEGVQADEIREQAGGGARRTRIGGGARAAQSRRCAAAPLEKGRALA